MRQKHIVRTKRNFLNAALVVLTGSILFAASLVQASSHEDMKKEVNEAAAAIGDYSVEQKDKAVAEAKEMMSELDRKWDETEASMKENWDGLKESSKENYELSKKEYNEQRRELSEWLDKMQDSSAGAWEETKKGFTEAHDSLSSSWERAMEKLNED